MITCNNKITLKKRMSKSFEVCFYCKSTSMISSDRVPWSGNHQRSSPLQFRETTVPPSSKTSKFWKSLEESLNWPNWTDDNSDNWCIERIGTVNICCTQVAICNFAGCEQSNRTNSGKGDKEEQQEKQQRRSNTRKRLKNSENNNQQKQCIP